MSDTTAVAQQGGEASEAIRGKSVFSYCCGCGTYDAHTSVCTCCGFDFRGDVLIEDETE